MQVSQAASRVTDKPLTGPAMNIPSPARANKRGYRSSSDRYYVLPAGHLLDGIALSMVKNQGSTSTSTVPAPPHRRSLRTTHNQHHRARQIYYNKEKIEAGPTRPLLEIAEETYAEPKVFVNGDEKAVFGKVVARPR